MPSSKDASPAQDAPPPLPPPHDYFANSKIWTKEDVAEWLGVCAEIVEYEMEHNKLPHVRMSSSPDARGRTIRFSEYKVKLWFWEQQKL